MFTVDSTGFPLVPCPSLGLEAALLPVTRAQFDFFLGSRANAEPERLAEIDAIVPRASWRAIPDEQPEGVFLTGLRVDDAIAFARWLGGGFRIMTDAEWRAVDADLGRRGDAGPLRALATDPNVHPAARAILNWRFGRGPATWRHAALLDDGVFEWVRKPDGFGWQGRPRPGLFRIIHNPQVHDAIAPRNFARHAGCGVRLVRPRPSSPQVP